MIPIKVSVIIPVYGVENCIRRCAMSLFQQTLEDIEFIFVDDCTKDKSIEVLQNVIDEYPRIRDKVKIVTHEHNMGLPIARKTGLIYANGEYVANCDSDDWVDPNMYKEMYESAVCNDADLVISNYYKHDGKEIISVHNGFSTLDYRQFTYLKDFALGGYSWAVWNKLFRRSLLECKVRYPKYNMGEDMTIVFQVLFLAKKISYVNKPLYFYYVNPSSLMNDLPLDKTLASYNQLINNIKVLYDVIDNNNYPRDYKRIVDYLYFRSSNILLPFICDKNIFDRWKEHFNGHQIDYYFGSIVPIKRKLRHLLIILTKGYISRVV